MYRIYLICYVLEPISAHTSRSASVAEENNSEPPKDGILRLAMKLC